ncbi:MAG: XdhC family protein [Micropruina sp.]|uniref:XdhC family protein n=1 Tax=Micropruina sp. TaxID=2737536 RepID=UPI0039E49CD9
MFELAEELLRRLDAGEPVAVVTVTRVLGSAPRPVGCSMAVAATASGERVLGAISGGCAESAAHALAQQVLASGAPVTEHLGFDEWAFSTGLSCGGQLRVLGYRLDASRPELIAELRAAADGSDAALAIVSRGPDELLGRVVTLTGGDAGLPAGVLGVVRRELADRLVDGVCGVLEPSDEVELAVLVSRARPRLLIFGAVDVAGALSRLGRQLGYRVTVCDARALFATAERFPDADQVVVDWPARYLASIEVDARTVIAVLTHEERFDVPLLTAALDGPAGYIGAMGSRRTHQRRLGLLREAGVSAQALERLHSPIGLDLGAVTPMETAVSIMAEVIASRTGAAARPLAQGSGPIHAVVVPA